MNLLLSIIAVVLFLLIEPFNFIFVVFLKRKFKWSRLNGYFRNLAIGVDRFGNYQFRSLFNVLFKTDKGYEFGNFNETVSSALGKNQRDNTLTKIGLILVGVLDFLDENHCLNSINENI